MVHHHHLPLILALILLILPSSSHAKVTPALFSDAHEFLSDGHNLTDDDITLALYKDCGLIIYKHGFPPLNFNTSTTTSNCILVLNQFGQLVLVPGDEGAKNQTIFKKGPEGEYALLFVGGFLAIYGPATWNNGIPVSSALKQGKLMAGTSNVFIVSGQTVNAGVNPQNGNVKVAITEHCELSVTDDTDSDEVVIWQSLRVFDNLTDCYLLVAYGQLLLQGYDGSTVVTQWTGGNFPSGINLYLYVGVLRRSGRISVYGLNLHIFGKSAAAAVAADQNIKMVTA